MTARHAGWLGKPVSGDPEAAPGRQAGRSRASVGALETDGEAARVSIGPIPGALLF